MKKFLVVALLQIVAFGTCVTKQPTLQLYPTSSEKLVYEMSNFFTGEQLSFQFDGEQPNFDISQPITARKAPTPLLEGTFFIYNPKVTSVLVSLQANIQPENGAWTNDFAFIEKGAVDKSWDLFYAEGYPYASADPPNFSKKINFVDPTVTKTTLCYDVDYLDKDTFIVDCADNSKIAEDEGALENYFYIFKKDVDPIDIDTKNKHFNTNYRGYKAVTKRKFQYHEYIAKNFGADGIEEETKQRVLLRGVLAYGSDQGTTTQLDKNCLLELYLVDDQNNFADTNQHLDRYRIAVDIGSDPLKTDFSLIDFKFLPNGDIYILDAKMGVFIYRVFKGTGWKFQKWLPTMFSDAYGFDLIYKLSSDGSTKKHMVVLYKDYIVTYVEDKMLTGIQIGMAPDFNANIHVSQKYILIWHDKVVHQYSFDNSQKVSQMTINFNTYAVNPYQPDIMYVSNTNAYRYQISSGFLQFPSTTAGLPTSGTGKVVAIDATDPNNKCTLTLTYDVLQPGNTEIKQLKNSPLPDSITFPSEAFDFGEIASGPGLNYAKLGAAESVDVKVHSLWDLKIKGVPEPNAADVVYSDVLINPDGDNRFYVLTQLKNKQVTILDCLSARKDDNHCTCAIQDQFTLDVQLEVFQSWYWYPSFTEQITYIFQDGGSTIGIYVSDDGKSEKIYTLKTPSAISSFVLLDEVYIIALPTQGAIHIYNQIFPVLGDPIKIDAAGLKAQGYTGWETFKPTKIYGNREVNSEVFFVRSGRYILAFNFKKTWTFLKQIPCYASGEVEITISRYTFTIVQIDSANQLDPQIIEYNYRYSDNIYQAKIWSGQIYERYQIQTPLTVDYSFTDGYTLVRALDTTTQKTVLLVFEPDILYHTALLKVIETGELIPDNTNLQVSMDGGSQMFIYLNDGKQQKIVSLLANPLMELTPNALKSQYVTRMDVGIQVSNFNNKKQDYKSNVVFLNTQTALVVNQASLDKRNVDFKFQTSVDTQQLIPLGNDWYSGAAMEFEAHCGSHCDDGYIYIQPPVHPLNHGAELASYSVNDGIPFGNFVAYQTDDKLVFQKTVDGDLGHAYTLPIPESAKGTKCTTIAGDSTIIFSGCQETATKWIIYVTRCTQAVKCTPQGTRIMTQYPIAKLLYKDSILYVLKGEINNLYLESGEISIHKVTFPTETSIEFETTVFNKRTLGSAQSIYFSDFDVQNIDGIYHKILVTEAKMIRGILSVDYDLVKNALRDGTAKQHSLSNLINDPAGQHFLGSKTLFYQVRYISTTPLKGGAFDAVILLTFDNVAQYGCQVHFDETKPENNYMDIVFLLNTYGSFTALNKVTVSNGYAAVPYVDQTNMVIAIYELPTKFTAGTTIDVAIQSGFTQSYISSQVGKVIQHPKVNEFALILYQIPTKAMGATVTPKLFANVHYGYGTPYALPIEWNIDAQPYLVVENASKLKTQDVTLLATNQFGTATGKINLKAIVKPNDNKGSSSSSNWWWITLLVLFGVALVAGGGYFAYTKLGRRGVDPLLVN